MAVSQNPDLIEQNQGHFRTQGIKISLIPLEYPGLFKKSVFLLRSVIRFRVGMDFFVSDQ